jgi:hypothetical protein
MKRINVDMRSHLHIWLGVALAAACSNSALAFDQRIVGAWSQSQTDCKATFVRSGKGFGFRQPVDRFRSAFIITPQNLDATSGLCKILKTVDKPGALHITLGCTSAVSYVVRDVSIKVVGESEIKYGFPDNKDLDVSFYRCTL